MSPTHFSCDIRYKRVRMMNVVYWLVFLKSVLCIGHMKRIDFHLSILPDGKNGQINCTPKETREPFLDGAHFEIVAHLPYVANSTTTVEYMWCEDVNLNKVVDRCNVTTENNKSTCKAKGIYNSTTKGEWNCVYRMLKNSKWKVYPIVIYDFNNYTQANCVFYTETQDQLSFTGLNPDRLITSVKPNVYTYVYFVNEILQIGCTKPEGVEITFEYQSKSMRNPMSLDPPYTKKADLTQNEANFTCRYNNNVSSTHEIKLTLIAGQVWFTGQNPNRTSYYQGANYTYTYKPNENVAISCDTNIPGGTLLQFHDVGTAKNSLANESKTFHYELDGGSSGSYLLCRTKCEYDGGKALEAKITFVLEKLPSPSPTSVTPKTSTTTAVTTIKRLDAELYYVREGVVNTYATGFIVPVPAHIADLEFMWQSLGRKPLPYVMGIDYESRGAMLPPQVNISERGVVPTTLQAFRVRLPCTGSRSAEILVTMQLNISAPDRAHKDVRLLFKRNKICLKGLSTVVSRNESAMLAGDPSRGSSGVVFAAGGCALAALALLAAAAAAGTLYRRGGKARHHDSIHTSYTTAAYGSHQNVLLRLDTLGRPPSSTGSYATIASLHKFPFGSRRSPSPYATTQIGEHVYAKPESRVSYYAASNLTHVSQNTITKDRITDPAEQLQYLTTPRSNIRLEILVHEGTFGRVYKGVFKRGDMYEEVLVKTVSDAASAMQAALLVAEGLRLCGLVHNNVLAPLAACAEEARKPLLVYCCASHSSNLKRFLTSCRLGHQAAPATRELVELGAQLACGLSYLHVQRIVHADVATRNCIVDEKLRLKVADNGLSRDLFPDDYHCLGDNENRPVKWMAPESLLQNQYTTASDVWSLGVALWELATLGASPLAELDAADVGAFLSGGYRPSQPHNCPDELYGLMSWCWTTSAAARPTAPQLLAALHDFRQALSTYI